MERYRKQPVNFEILNVSVVQTANRVNYNIQLSFPYTWEDQKVPEIRHNV